MADAFVKNEFRTHLAAAAEALQGLGSNESELSVRSTICQQDAANDSLPSGPQVTDGGTREERRLLRQPGAEEWTELETKVQEEERDISKARPAANIAASLATVAKQPQCSFHQLNMFLDAWDEYLRHAKSGASPLHFGRSLRPSQRKLLSADQRKQLTKLKCLAGPSPLR
ncbi:hypothetical protein cyc_02550 [Cyclospora cayetanensis]|uniref:Uncharacterized protein n=1 Tax=Cyclospora cayetanensis TaxID=88456 RepID=A0A1D3CVE3_9EIME|nr:hypothetical protein cyc_02550 [Cyclospora cayetanensis]